MAALTIRNLSDETHRALKIRAATHGRSVEAEVRAILEAAVAPQKQVRLGTQLRALQAATGGLELDIKRDAAPTDAASFE